ncbi:Pectinesterase inhibitor 6 Pectin methylesterase [Vigna angularis]|uniref:Pectinesterase n=1 Tax=Phaseolus angularis TaxID=3914 RepID=A0A8T0LG69_PHAAN|nr:Pectinesterase inhibitor 6 Pectin methylesterase [Vigna angularis]
MEKLIFNCFIGCCLLYSLLPVHGKPLSCNETPYPHVCKHYVVTTNTLSTLDAPSSSFHDVALKVTVDQAMELYKLVSNMDLNNFKDKRAKSAWEDCLELYEDTLYQLKRSANSNNLNDRLTWQSASIANHQTCQNGFTELNVPSHLNYFPNMLSNFSKLLSNSLSLSKAMTLTSLSSTKQNGGRKLLSDGFPSWISHSDRRLLQETTSKADVVVAQDGSGNYKTISEGVAAASKLSGKGRVVVHVKAGVYKENIDISRTVKNLMIIGDGMGATIVTGSRNAQDGSTTFRSATFGWSEWSGNFALSTLYYGEHANTGAGAGTGGRVNWGGFRVLSSTEAVKFTVGEFLAGGSWIPGSGVPFDAEGTQNAVLQVVGFVFPCLKDTLFLLSTELQGSIDPYP